MSLFDFISLTVAPGLEKCLVETEEVVHRQESTTKPSSCWPATTQTHVYIGGAETEQRSLHTKVTHVHPDKESAQPVHPAAV